MHGILSFFLLLMTCSCLAQIPQFKVGLAKTDITSYKKGAGMLGYGMSFNVVEGVHTPLYARSFVIEDLRQQKIALVECELCFIPSELKSNIIRILQQDSSSAWITEENLMIMAQHTHSAPGGYCHYASYNMSVPGFIPELYDSLSIKIARSISTADRQRIPCTIKLAKGSFPETWEVAFNRSLAAYNNNKDVLPLAPAERHKAVNREMTLMHFEGNEGLPLGSINWFGVHATNLSNDNRLIHSDNKGYAASYLETYYRAQNKQYIGAFAQGTAGDVTPKFVYNPGRHWQRGYWEGKYRDDDSSAQYNGQLQYRKALELIAEAGRPVQGNGSIHYALRYFDFSGIVIDTMYSHTAAVQTTGPSCIGLSMLGGALMDGPGASPFILGMAKVPVRLIKKVELARAGMFHNKKTAGFRAKYAVQGKKDIVLETGTKKLLGTGNVKGLFLPGFADPTIAAFKHFHRMGALEEYSWSPQVLPVQLVQIGDIVLVGIPFEITTIAGRRLKKGIEELYAGDGIEEVILCPYANSYSGYITTYEEYQEQLYEGGHSVFGAYSLAALQTVIQQLHREKDDVPRGGKALLRAPAFSREELMKRCYYKRK